MALTEVQRLEEMEFALLRLMLQLTVGNTLLLGICM